MYLCKHCGKFSKSTKMSESQEPTCPKCGTSIHIPPLNSPVPLTREAVKPKDDSLPPGFGAIIQFTPIPQETSDTKYLRGTMVLKYAAPLDIPGTNYCLVLPMQAKVSPRDRGKENNSNKI